MNKLLTLLIVCLPGWSAVAQDLHLLLLDSTQMRSINPAFTNTYAFDLYAGAYYQNTGNVSFNDIFVEEGDNYVLKQDALIQNLPDKVDIFAEAKAEVLHGSINLGFLSLLVGYDQRAYVTTSTEKELIDLFLNGNASYIGREIKASPQLGTQYYHSFSLGAQLDIQGLNVGLRAHRHWGIAGSSMPQGNFRLYTSDDIYQLELNSDLTLNSYAPDEIQAFNTGKNAGFSIDLGVSYDYEKGSIFLAANDLGYIDYTEGVNNYQLESSQSFEGIDLAPFIEDSDRKVSFQDTIDKYINYTESFNEFTMKLPAKFYAGFTHELGETSRFGLTYHPVLVHGDMFHRFTGQAQYSLLDFLTLGASLTADKNSPVSLGGYLQMSLAGVNLTLSGHNLPALVNWKSAKTSGAGVYLSVPFR